MNIFLYIYRPRGRENSLGVIDTSNACKKSYAMRSCSARAQGPEWASARLPGRTAFQFQAFQYQKVTWGKRNFLKFPPLKGRNPEIETLEFSVFPWVPCKSSSMFIPPTESGQFLWPFSQQASKFWSKLWSLLEFILSIRCWFCDELILDLHNTFCLGWRLFVLFFPSRFCEDLNPKWIPHSGTVLPFAHDETFWTSWRRKNLQVNSGALLSNQSKSQ